VEYNRVRDHPLRNPTLRCEALVSIQVITSLTVANSTGPTSVQFEYNSISEHRYDASLGKA